MGVVTDHGALFHESAKRSSFSLTLDLTAANALGPTAPVRARTRAGLAIAEAVQAKDTKYGCAYCPTYKSLPLAFSTCGNYSSSAQDLVEELGQLKTETAEVCLEATGQDKEGRHPSAGDGQTAPQAVDRDAKSASVS